MIDDREWYLPKYRELVFLKINITLAKLKILPDDSGIFNFYTKATNKFS